MSKFIGKVTVEYLKTAYPCTNEIRIDASGGGVEVNASDAQEEANVTVEPSDARGLAAFLIQAADEVERMRAERTEFTHEGIAAPGNPRFDRGG